MDAVQSPKKQLFFSYYIHEENGNKLDAMPTYVDYALLAFLEVDWDKSDINFTPMLRNFKDEVIPPPEYIKRIDNFKKAVKTIKDRSHTKVLFSFQDNANLGRIMMKDGVVNSTFVENVKKAVHEWNVDGIDFDYETNNFDENCHLIELVKGLRGALGKDYVLTAPVYTDWIGPSNGLDYLKKLSPYLDYVFTMDYTPYKGLADTLSYCDQYIAHIDKGWDKMVIGMSCMTRDLRQPPEAISVSQDYTPNQDVERLAKYDKTRPKAGAMLWTWTYDVTHRNTHEGTGENNGAVSKRIYDNLQLSLG